MSDKPNSFLRVLTESGPLVALAVAIALLVGIVRPASAQFFNFGFGAAAAAPATPQQRQRLVRRRVWALFEPFQRQSGATGAAPAILVSHAPRPDKRDTVPERHVLVLGDAMADWLAYGLEDALSEQPDMGVIRKHKTVSGLIKYQPQGEPPDWAAAAKGILATEKPDAIVVMLGLHDRMAIREPVAEKPDKKDDKKDARGKAGDKAKAERPNRQDRAGRPRRKPRTKPRLIRQD